jgi:hypothetical protein
MGRAEGVREIDEALTDRLDGIERDTITGRSCPTALDYITTIGMLDTDRMNELVAFS